MNISSRPLTVLLLAAAVSGGLACDSSDPPTAPAPAPPAAQPPAGEIKSVPLNENKTLFFETLPGGKRRVVVMAEVCLREGALEVFLCRNQTKEHEAILHAEFD